MNCKKKLDEAPFFTMHKHDSAMLRQLKKLSCTVPAGNEALFIFKHMEEKQACKMGGVTCTVKFGGMNSGSLSIYFSLISRVYNIPSLFVIQTVEFLKQKLSSFQGWLQYRNLYSLYSTEKYCNIGKESAILYQMYLFIYLFLREREMEVSPSLEFFQSHLDRV